MSDNTSSRTTLKNTVLVGGSEIVTLIIKVIKGKFIAILLGPSGIGLVQLFESTIQLVQSISNLGIGFSGVRDIAQSISSEDELKLSKTMITLKRWSWLTGILGVTMTVLMSKKLSYWTFGDEKYWIEMSILSLTILMANITAGYTAIIRGARRMADFARITIISSLIGTIFTVLIYYFYGVRGIVPVLLLTGLITLIVNIFYAVKIQVTKVSITLKNSFYDGLEMVKLGVFTVITGFITMLSMYYVRISINDNIGIDSVGYYAAASALAVTYMGLIFSSMGKDYFPKVSAINKDDKALNKAIVEQTKILLLLGTPLIILMFTFSEYLIQILYTNEFLLALPLLMWLLLSVFLKLIGFPIGYVFLAKGKGKIFIFTQSLWNIIFVSFVYFLWNWRGDLVGVGIAFNIAGIIGVFANIVIIKRMTNFKYDKETILYFFIFSFIVLFYFYFSYFNFNSWLVYVLKIIGLILISLYCFKKIQKLMNIEIISLIKSKFLKTDK